MTDESLEDVEPTDVEREDVEREAVSAPERGRSRGLLLASVAAGVFLVLAVVMTIVAVSVKGDQDAESKDRRAVESVSGRLGEALISWDYENPELTRSAVLALATGKFRDEYDQEFDGLKTFGEQRQLRAVGQVRTIWVGEIDEGTASAVLVADRSISTVSGQRSENDIYLKLDLVNVDGDWRVDGVTNLRFTLSSTGDAETTTTSTTTP